MTMSNHMMQRLSIAREDPSIRQAIPSSNMRSQQQAMAEAQMMRAAILAKTLAGRDAGSAAGAAAGAAAGSPATRMAAGSARTASYPTAPSQDTQKPASGSPRPFMRQPMSAAAAPPGPMMMAPAPAPPALPFVYRRAAQDVQITDPVAGDLMQLDRGTWVLTAPAANPARNSLTIYTTDEDAGAVVSYEVPLPDGRIASLFDMHTLNPLDTVTISGTEAQ
jgi:hypothetical protein